MKTEDAIALLRKGFPAVREIQEAAGVLIVSYEILAENYSKVGPTVLDQMQQAADWEAVAITTISLLQKRKMPGAEADIEKFIAQLKASNAPAPNAGSSPAG